MNIVWLDQDACAQDIGGKGFRLSRLARASFPVPRGFCVTVAGLAGITTGELDAALSELNTNAVAIRSSAVEEDGCAASFAGIYVTRLNVSRVQEMMEALAEIRHSASSAAAKAYRNRRGIHEEPRMAAVVQEFVQPITSGVLFMQDPIDGAPRVEIEASWGLGEAVVSGRVTPDRWVLSPQGQLISSTIADKDVTIVAARHGTQEISVDPSRRQVPCLNENVLCQLFNVAKACEQLFENPQDIEWAADEKNLWILQSRPITCRAQNRP